MKQLIFFLWLVGFNNALCDAPVPSSALRRDFKIGLVLDSGGKDDKGFNSLAFKGASDAKASLDKDKFEVTLSSVETKNTTAVVDRLGYFAKNNYDVVVSVGDSQQSALLQIAKKFPKVAFVIVDAEVPLPNVQSLVFNAQQGSYLVGALAAMHAKNRKVGFIGGADNVNIRAFKSGFDAGVKKIAADKPITVVENFVGIGGADSWGNPTKAKQLAVMQYGQGVDVIFVAAGASSVGVYAAAEESKKLAVAVDQNQNGLKPGFILTSLIKRVDVAVHDACVAVAKKRAKAGTKTYDVTNNGFELVMDKNNEKMVTQAQKEKLKELREGFVKGSIDLAL